MFSKLLLEWYDRAHRDLPWRRTQDPYAIWVSEIMLQQTRVATVIPYYERFLSVFPNPAALANAGEEQLLGAWAGLGYYSRVRNMQRAAQQMPEGVFPRTWDEIRELPGVGEYTAAAVGSIAFGLPHAAVDGNVLRVLSRVTNEAGDIGSAVVRERLRATAEELLDRERPGAFNQAMMELGATVCVPKDPACLLCPVAASCEARKLGRQNELPVKLRRMTIHRKTRRVFVVRRGASVLLWRRTNRAEKLAGFWELPEEEHFAGSVPRGKLAGVFRHAITNHQYVFEVHVVGERRDAPELRGDLDSRWVRVGEDSDVVVSTTVRKALGLESVRAM